MESKEYIKIHNDKAYHLLNSGALVLVSTVSKENEYDITPIAWHSPVDFDPTTRLLFVTDKEHKTYKNICETKVFGISIIHRDQIKIVKELGSISGHHANKIDKFTIQTHDAETINCKLPDKCIGYLECQVYNVIEDGGVAIIFGEVISAMVDKNAYNHRLICENEAGKTLHHLSGKIFIAPANETIM